MVDRIDIEVTDRIPEAPARKLRDLATRADTAADALDRLQVGIDDTADSLTRLVSAQARQTSADARLLNAQTRSTQAQDRRAISAQRLATEQLRTAAASERATTAATRSRIALIQEEAATVRLAAAKQRQQQATVRATQAEERHNAVLGVLGRVGRQTRGIFQQLGFQVQDVAVQLQMGTDVAIVLGQQLPQIAGAFGAVGAAIGAALAVAIPLAAQFVDFNALFGRTESQLTALASATRDYRDATESAFDFGEDFVRQFGRQAERARELFQIEREILRLRAETQQRSVFGQIAADISDIDFVAVEELLNVQQETLRLERERRELLQVPLVDRTSEQILALNEINFRISEIVNQRQDIDELAARFGITAEQAITLANAAREAQTATDYNEQAESFERLRRTIVSVLGPIRSQEQAVIDLLEQILLAERNSISLAAAAGRITFDGARQSADDLVRSLNAALRVLDDIESRAAQRVVTRRGLTAQRDALRRGLTPDQARVEGQIAERLQEAAPALGLPNTGRDALTRRQVIEGLQQEAEELRTNAVIRGEINERVREFNELQRENRRRTTPGRRTTAQSLSLQIDQLEQQLEQILDADEARTSRIELDVTRRLDVVRRAREANVINAREEAEILTNIERAKNQEILNLERARLSDQLTAASQGFSDLARITRAGLGEQSGAYRAFFAISKAFAIADAIININTAISRAFSVAFPFNIPLIAQAASQGARIVNVIRSTEPQGFQVGGFTGRGSESEVAGVVHREEFVMPASATRAIGLNNLEAMRRTGRMPSRAERGPSQVVQPVVNVRIVNNGRPMDFETQVTREEVLIIATEAANAQIQRNAPDAVAQAMANPSSSVSQSFSTNTTARRRR
jgi:hypothetical protein